MKLNRMIHQGLVKLAARWPAFSNRLVAGFTPRSFNDVPWTRVSKPIALSKVALVTTAGLHHRRQLPFDMADSNGDPSFREIDNDTIERDFVITHDYYDHLDADLDLNVVFPISHLKAMQQAGCIGMVANKHFAFMGHIDGKHVDRLVNHSAPQVARLFKKDKVDMVILTPA